MLPRLALFDDPYLEDGLGAVGVVPLLLLLTHVQLVDLVPLLFVLKRLGLL